MNITILQTKINAYHAHNKTLAQAIKLPVNSPAVNEWFKTLKDLKEDAGKEFARLTADRNSPGCYSVVTIPFMESLVKSVTDGKYS